MTVSWLDNRDEGSFVAEEIRAEMVANVLIVQVEEGQTVEPGQQVVILESMKMEIPVLAEGGGVVSRISVGAGDVVQEGDVMVELS
jgi:biotin carboxyl carrier protein